MEPAIGGFEYDNINGLSQKTAGKHDGTSKSIFLLVTGT